VNEPAIKRRKGELSHGKHCWIEIGVWSAVDEKCERLSEYVHCRNCPVFSTAGRRVFDKSAPPGYLPEWRKKLAVNEPLVDQNNEGILIFRLNAEWFAVAADCLEEITEERTVHRIPRNKNMDIEGIVNVSGEVQVCYSLKQILGVKAEPVTESVKKHDITVMSRFVVASFGGQCYVFRVDQISGLRWYSTETLFSAPVTIENEAAGMLLGVINEGNLKIAVLDVAQLQTRLEGIRL